MYIKQLNDEMNLWFGRIKTHMQEELHLTCVSTLKAAAPALWIGCGKQFYGISKAKSDKMIIKSHGALINKSAQISTSKSSGQKAQMLQ
jgi:hypothetical protein